ncbi:hypothetical protein QTP70_024699 [Hemibagrus guttatus]|uniref:Uncharacterized protein n=1 Tax=Hemibagrus guttatus TaxID=175788 RepID=A0AAE0RKF1_9TELE|nr:hypothetical protein QTP70_024699 [Hemibagrus guttatus]KAK3575069.1 hypothetical protein QTP86_019754 [Hemibagrus guttatus]
MFGQGELVKEYNFTFNPRGRDEMAQQRGKRCQTKTIPIQTYQSSWAHTGHKGRLDTSDFVPAVFSSSTIRTIIDNTNANAAKRLQARKKNFWKPLTE